MLFIASLFILELSSSNSSSSVSSWADYGSFPVAIVAILVFFLTYIATSLWNNVRLHADRYDEILKMGIHNTKLMDPKMTRNYIKIWPLGAPDRSAYEIYAWLCWEHAYHLYSSFSFPIFRNKLRKYFLKRYVNVLEAYTHLHLSWLKNNISFFPDIKFQQFIYKRQWRDYFDARMADLLRWNYEVDDYDEKIMHPLLVKANNPLLNFIDNIQDKELIVADFGCGIGTLINKLSASPNIKKIYGIDYADKMIECCKSKCNCEKVEIIKKDMTDLNSLLDELGDEKLDIAFSINSILPRDPRDTEIMFNEIAKTLKPSGKFVAVLPSFDTIEYLKKLYFKKFKVKREKKNKTFSYLLAWYDTWKHFSRERKMNVGKRLYADDTINVQRFIHVDEIKPLLDKAGLKILKQEELRYPWKIAEKFGYGYFKDEPEIWDWFVVSEVDKTKSK